MAISAAVDGLEAVEEGGGVLMVIAEVVDGIGDA
jgi:hypothetical protein